MPKVDLLQTNRASGEHTQDVAGHPHDLYDPNFSMPEPGRPQEYVTDEDRWTDGGGIATVLGGTGGTISWSLGGTGLYDTTGVFYSGASVAMSTFLPFDFEATLQRAFDAWSVYGEIDFVQVADGGGNIGVGESPTIRVVGGYIDGQGGPNVLARAFYPHPGAFGGDIVFDSGNANFYANEHYFFLTALHEIGHAIGLLHEEVGNAIAVMNPAINTSLTGLQPDDIAGVQAIYGVQVNDAPTLTAAGSNPTFSEGGAAGSLFSGTTVSTVENGQRITGLSFTVTNVANGSNERINVDGTPVVLAHGANGSTAGNALSYSVMVAGTTATITMTGGALSAAAAQTMIDNMSYQNMSNTPSTSDRVVTLTSIQDTGGTANGGVDLSSLAIASTVAVVGVNDAPTLGLRYEVDELLENIDTGAGLRVANIRLYDADGGNNLLSLSGADASLFELDGFNVILRPGVTLDYETNPVLDVTVNVTDSGVSASSSTALSINVLDVNEVPVLEVSQLVQALPAGTSGPMRSAVATFTVRDDGLGANVVSLRGADASAFELDAGVLYLRAGMVLEATETLDLLIDVDDPSLGSGPESSTAFAFEVLETVLPGEDTDDLLIGTFLTDTLSGFGGNDTLVGLEGDDVLNGGDGGDVAVFTGPAESYTMSVTPEGVFVTDRREDGDGSDLLIGIETIRFGADPAGAPQEGDDFDLANYSGASLLTAEQLEAITQFYVGLYDRAPDALGLLFWATQLASGVDEATIAQAFINSPEAINIYGAAPTSLEIVEAAYRNFFDREVDLAGQVFWSELLDIGAITTPEFFTLLDEGAEAQSGSSLDATVLQDQLDIGLYFAAINGLSGVSNATAMLALYEKEDRDSSLSEIKSTIDTLALEAFSPDGGDFVVQLTGVIDDPFA